MPPESLTAWVRTTSTRRFLARLASVSLGATGFSGPKPWYFMREFEMPWAIRNS